MTKPTLRPAVSHAGAPAGKRGRIPSSCVVDAESYDVKDWSAGGFAFDNYRGIISRGDRIRTQLVFPFQNHSLFMTVECEARNYDSTTGRVDVRLLVPSQNKTDVLRFLIDAYLSGEIESIGDVIEVAARKTDAAAGDVQFLDSKSPTSKAPTGAGRIVRGALVTVASLALVAFIGVNLYERSFVRPATAARIDVETMALTAPAAGMVTAVSAAKSFAKGESVFSVQERGGVIVPVASPCDCVLLAIDLPAGSFVREGQVVLRISDKDVKPFVRATVDADTLMLAHRGGVAELGFVDGKKTEMSLENLPKTLVGPKDNRVAAGTDVRMETGRSDLSMANVGDPVAVRFDSAGNSAIGKLFRTLSSLR